jgi:nitrite reductase (NADH) small subunit
MPLTMIAWRDVCALEEIWPDCGAAALIGAQQIAIFRIGEDQVYALSNFDPFSQAFVLARGIVGDRGGRLKVASPIYKQSFDLRTGECLDDPAVAVPAYPARVRAGRIEIAVPDDAGGGGQAGDRS